MLNHDYKPTSIVFMRDDIIIQTDIVIQTDKINLFGIVKEKNNNHSITLNVN